MKLNLSESNLLYWLSITPLLLLATQMTTGIVIGLVMLFMGGIGIATQSICRAMFVPPVNGTLLVIALGTGAALSDILLQAFAWHFYDPIHAYLPLIAIGMLYFLSTEDCATDHSAFIHSGIIKNAKQIVSAALAVAMCGGIRELLSSGALFNQLGELFGAEINSMRLEFSPSRRGIIGAALAPTALIGIGLVIAACNRFNKSEPPAKNDTLPLNRVSQRRVRVSGPIA